MTITMYAASVPVFIRMFENLIHILDKASAYATDRKIDPVVLVNYRLHPDMLPLSRQVQIATDIAKGCAARLAGVEPVRYEDNEATLEELMARVRKTIDLLKGFSAAQIDGSEDRDIRLTVGGRELSFKGLSYLLNFVLPNVYFHITITYAILRHCGVDLGKADFLGKT
jgi:hypothetical protein